MDRFFNLLIKFFLRLKLLFEHYWAESYSQEGEDMILRKIFEKQQPGFYVDVGAHHPKRFSNTYYFYKRGLNGINIDATPGSMKLFYKFRRKDINIESAISKEKKELILYSFDEPAINTFDEALAQQRSIEGKYKLIDEIKIHTKTLSEILGQHLPLDKEIDFLSVDVEGFDLEVLQSNDWNRFRPKFVVVECFGIEKLERITSDEVYIFLTDYNYFFYAKTMNTCIFKDSLIN